MRTRHSRLLTAAAVVVAAGMALAGCSAGGGGTSADGKTHVIFWQQQFEPYQQKWFKKYVDKYNASQSKVQVDIQVVPADAWAQKLKAAQAAGKQPDVATTNYGSINAGVANGQFTDLDSLLPAKSFDDIKSNVADFVEVKGKHYAYPMLVEPSTVLYYRTDLVQAAGLDPNTPPKTWDELLTWSKALTQGNVKGMSIASVTADLQWSSWGLQYNSCGQFPISSDWSKGEATKSCFADLANFYKSLYQGGYMPKTPKVPYADVAPYGNGEVAMIACGSWAVGALKNDYAKMVDKTAVAAFPSKTGDPDSPTATLGGWTLTVDSKSKAKQQAADFIQYLLAGDPAIMADFFKVSGYSKYTVRTSVDEALADDSSASNDPFMQTISSDVVAHGVAEPAYPIEISAAMGTAIESTMKGNASADQSLKTAEASIDSVIQKQQLKGTEPQ